MFLTVIQNPMKGFDPQGHPPSTFLFLPMKLSNSRIGQSTTPTPERQAKSAKHNSLAHRASRTIRFKWRRVSARRKLRGDAVDGRGIKPHNPNRQAGFCGKKPNSTDQPVDKLIKHKNFNWLCNLKIVPQRPTLHTPVTLSSL
jgi:hypothetical protein